MKSQSLGHKFMTMFSVSLLSLAIVSLISQYIMKLSADNSVNVTVATLENLAKVKKIGEIKLLFGLQVQEWKNTIIRGATVEGNAKYSASFDQVSTKIITVAESLLPQLQENDRGLLTDFIKAQSSLKEKYIAARTTYLGVNKFLPAQADSAVHGLDRKVLDSLKLLDTRISEYSVKDNESASAAIRHNFIFVFILLVTIVVISLSIGRRMTMKMAEAEILANAAANRSSSMVEHSPIMTMVCDPAGMLIYMNQSAIENLKKLQNYFPEKVDQMIGKSIDIFHKNPALQRTIISNPKNLPHKAIINLGPETLDILITSIIDPNEKYLGAALTWSNVTAKVELVNELAKASDHLASAANNVLSVATNLSAAAEETSSQANTASVASEEVNSGVQTMASNMSEMVSANESLPAASYGVSSGTRSLKFYSSTICCE